MTFPLAAVLLASLAVLLSAATWWQATPPRLRREWDSTRDAFSEVRHLAEELRREWTAYKTGLESLLEEIESLYQRVERKRKSAAASASRASRGNGFDENTREGQIAALRARLSQQGRLE